MLKLQFLENKNGHILVTSFQCSAQLTSLLPSNALIVIQPLAEELNCSRRQFSEMGLALTNHHYDTFIPDFFGTADSEGDFSEITLATLLEDIDSLCQYLVNKGYKQITFLGLRLGANLISEYLSSRERQGYFQNQSIQISNIILWSLIENPALYIKQLYRLKSANALTQGKQLNTKALEDDLNKNHYLEVAGYTFTDILLNDINSLSSKLQENTQIAPVQYCSFNLPDIKKTKLTNQLNTIKNIQITHYPYHPFWLTHESLVSLELIKDTIESLIKPLDYASI
jgi:exosortase A-associated hydrolase 2